MAGDTYNGPTAGQSGDGNTQHNHFHGTQPAGAPWPHLVGRIPALAECFQARAEAVRLRQALAGGGTAVVGQPAPAGGVLAGMGGVGKTQLAADYARTALSAGELDVLVWITASSGTAATSGYGQAGVEVLGADPADPTAAAQKFLSWLEPKGESEPCRWLVVLDDIADPAALNGMWPPSSPHGRTLATTRRQDAAMTGPSRRRIDVGVFTRAEAADYLTEALAAHNRTEPADDITALTHDLGCLPLALSQAAAYMIDAGKSCAAYRTLLADRTRTLAELSPDILPDGQNHTMAAAWSLSMDYADQLSPVGLARPMLQLAAFLDPNSIPIGVLISQEARAYLAACRTNRSAPEDEMLAVSVDDADGALRALRRLSLIHIPSSAISSDRLNGSSEVVRVHQVIQRATRDSLSAARYDRTARVAADALTAAWPNTERDTALTAALRANTAALLASGEDSLLQPSAHVVLLLAGRSLGESGQVAAASEYFTRLHTLLRQHLGPDHLEVLVARGDLARWRGEAGDAAGAVTATEELLHDQLRILGPNHPEALITRSNLARWQGEAGDAAGAVTAYEELLHDQLPILGPNHPNTLTIRGNIAAWRGEAGDAAGAVTAYEELLHDQLRVLGPNHPDTLITRGNIAGWRGEAGDAAGAATATEELLHDRSRVLGPNHPDTLATRGSLARWRGAAGDAAGAVTAYEELLQDQLRILGPNHPSTLTTRGSLAGWRGEAGDAAGAVTAYEELLQDQLRILGPNHPSTLTTRGNLAAWRGEAGDAAGAITATEELLHDRSRVLGPNHPDTLTTRNNLARWRGAAGDAAGAATAYEELLHDQLPILGPNHPNTLNTRGNLAAWRGAAGDAAGAATATEELLHDQLRILGPNHPDTLITRSNLAAWRGAAGDAAGAATAYEELLHDQLPILGPNHPNTLTTRSNLAAWRGEAGDAAGAATATEELLHDQLRILGPNHPNTLITRNNLTHWLRSGETD
ncbi:FxSxx-COOH system tetratricopeptide repeat protein [Streptomyces sp. NBC_00986]|uniref:FxSxx-COOH system tetratricopeptide repeat protein n=1 Tax=Streptomyces sp. NBC_00986 TaxID=2903702 RepID=UPI0038690CA1|nr:FxSxx-COOH system tetratricopeptide repeat protein [Streptomyces sp. NBC_00986]